MNVCGLVDNRSIVDCLTHKISSTGDLSREWYNSIYARAIAELKINPQQYDPQEIEKAIMNAFPIPAAFHEDLTLRSYICPITLEPIRYPVEEPTTRDHQQDQDNPVLYERSAIMNILESNPISPITQKPLTVDQLIPRQDIQDMIEMRLEHYSSNIWNYLETNPFSSNDLNFEDRG
ncbi:U-box domain-containing protein [Candidatus Rhabdochlamydia sp. T3358]|uniref:U-box domain-containing protein n=1 Tax=Candidatus Rhabdochlamydia sp. T3358 TaxID=2099795 RepID=UPI0010BC2510|nr:U-box domain-containing protein [Candidatus Rhabdochlamydia sp. T3358]VHO04239.1 U-box domain protein [Candidatus Rhabdochlamydia sp. T3358]